MTCPNSPAFSMTFLNGTIVPPAASSYLAMYDPGNAAAGWNTISGPATATGNTFAWTGAGYPYPLLAGQTYAFVAFSTTSTLAVATPTPTPTPAVTPTPLHLYVGNDNTSGAVLQYNLPLTASSTPNFSIASNNVVSVAVDANGNLAVGDYSGNLQFFTAPLSGSSTPAAAFKNGAATNDGQIAFTNAGDFWASTLSNRVNGFIHPFTNATTPSSFITDPAMVSTVGAAFDGAQNLYISNTGVGTSATCPSGAGKCSDLLVYAPPHTGAPIITPNVDNTSYRKIVVTATQLFAASVSNSPGRVDVFNLPITAASLPAFSIVTGVNTPEGLATDPSGKLYVGNLSDATVSVYSPPITAGKTPDLILKVSTGPFAIFGIAVGK